jgi:hypothetical protein
MKSESKKNGMFLTRRLVKIYRVTIQVQSGFFLIQKESYQAIEKETLNPETKDKIQKYIKEKTR